MHNSNKVRPDPEIKGRGPGLKIFFFVWSKNKAGGRGAGSPGMNPNLVTVSWKKTILHRKASFKEWKESQHPSRVNFSERSYEKQLTTLVWKLVSATPRESTIGRHYPDLGSASGWLKQISHTARTVRSTNQMEFLRSSFRRLFAKKQAVESQNVFWPGKYPARYCLLGDNVKSRLPSSERSAYHCAGCHRV